MTASSPIEALPGAVLGGRYRLIERLGSGESGVVWRCRDLELDDDEVALKLLRDDLAGAEGMCAWLRREGRLARRVTHPNVARVFELGRDEGGHFLTMEYIAGESLRAWIDQGTPMSPAWVQVLAVSLCRGLTAALAVGVAHGAVRASNILLAPGRGVVLTDLRVARAAPPVDAAAPASLAYLAPERLQGGDITPRSDVYAVGVVLFEALVGRLPWAPGDPEDRAPRLRERAPELPAAWADLLADCLRPDPGDRLPDVRSVLVRMGASSRP